MLLPLWLLRLCSLYAALLALGLTAASVQAQAQSVHRYVKVSNAGKALPDTAALGSGPNDWACTYDRVKQLIWEVKTDGGLRSQKHKYSWYDSNEVAGAQGSQGNTFSCSNTLSGNNCNTESYVNAVNAANLCGVSDWRMPTVDELESLFVTGLPAIDMAWFPNTPPDWFWTGESDAPGSSEAWFVFFFGGGKVTYDKDLPVLVRLVRGGQSF